MSYLLTAFLIAVAFNLLLFIPAFIFRTDKLTDLSYALTFALLAFIGASLNGFAIAYAILFLMILIWAIRLGAYLLVRISRSGRDKRFDGIRESFSKFFKFWFLQGISVWLVMISSLLFFQEDFATLSFISYLGIIVWAFGLIFESVADWQKYKFIRNKNNEGKWISRGLWKYSRHPNYFGEITVWTGVYLYTLSALSGSSALFALISPVYIAVLIIFVSGLPMLEKYADKKWGDNPDYLKYKNNTNTLIPWFPKK